MLIVIAEIINGIHRILKHSLGKDIQRIDDVIGKHLTRRGIQL